MKKKINVLESALKNKKKIFKNKQDPLVLLKEIDNNSPCKKIKNAKTMSAPFAKIFWYYASQFPYF